MMEILNNKNTYKELDKNKIKELTRGHETELTKKEIKYQSRQLEGLPKIYKSNLAMYK